MLFLLGLQTLLQVRVRVFPQCEVVRDDIIECRTIHAPKIQQAGYVSHRFRRSCERFEDEERGGRGGRKLAMQPLNSRACSRVGMLVILYETC